METRTFPLPIAGSPEADADAAGALTRLRGIAVPYDVETIIGGLFVETFARGAFAASLRATPNVPLLVNHDPGDPIGVADSWDDRRDGLHGVWRIGTSARAQEVAAEVRDGLRAFMSVRFASTEDGSIWAPPARAGHLERVTRVRARLVEVSIVTTPAYAGATITDVRHAGPSVVVPGPGRRAVEQLALDTGTPLILAAITGDDAAMGTAAAMVRTAIEVEGTDRARRFLDDMAGTLALSRPQLALNLTRAAASIDRTTMDPALRDEHVAQFRRLLPPEQADRPGAGAPGRSRRRR